MARKRTASKTPTRREKTQARMDRLRALRGLPPLRTNDPRVEAANQMERVYAARCLIDATANHDNARTRSLELRAFMSIFHPETPQKMVDDMVRDVRRRAA